MMKHIELNLTKDEAEALEFTLEGSLIELVAELSRETDPEAKRFDFDTVHAVENLIQAMAPDDLGEALATALAFADQPFEYLIEAAN